MEVYAILCNCRQLVNLKFFFWFLLFFSSFFLLCFCVNIGKILNWYWNWLCSSLFFVYLAIKSTIDVLANEGLTVRGYVVDISNREEVAKSAKLVQNDIGHVDILINNAGIVCCKPLWDLPEKVIEKTYAVNILSHYWVSYRYINEHIFIKHLAHVLVIFILCVDHQGLSARHDGHQPWPHCDSWLGGRFAGHVRLHRLLCHQIRLCRIPRSPLHRIENTRLRGHSYDAGVSVLHCIGHVCWCQTAHVSNAHTEICCRSNYQICATQRSQLHIAG